MYGVTKYNRPHIRTREGIGNCCRRTGRSDSTWVLATDMEMFDRVANIVCLI
jgi:hypothetical protein